MGITNTTVANRTSMKHQNSNDDGLTSYDSYRFGLKRFVSPFKAFRKPSTSPSFSSLMVNSLLSGISLTLLGGSTS